MTFNCTKCQRRLRWPQPYVKGQRPVNDDTGETHDCPAYGNDKWVNQTPQQTQQQPQGPSRYETNWLIPKENWDSLQSDVSKIKTDSLFIVGALTKITTQLNQEASDKGDLFADLLHEIRELKTQRTEQEQQGDLS